MTWNTRETLEANPKEIYTVESGTQRVLAMIDLGCCEPKKDPHREARIAYWGAVAYKLLRRSRK